MKPSVPSRRALMLAVLPATALVLVSAWDVIATLGSAHEAPDSLAWHGAQKAVRDGYQPGDLIVFTPRWIDPIGRYHLGDLISLRAAGRMDSATFAQIWEVSSGDRRHAETEGISPRWQKRFGRLLVRRYEKKRARVITDFVEKLSTARLEGGHERPPRVDLASIMFRARRCIRLTVGGEGSARVVYPQALLGDEIVGYVGLVDEFPRLRKRAERGRLRLFVGASSAAQVEITGPWTRFSAKTSAETRADVIFEASASGPSHPNRLICIAAQARR